MTINEIAEHAEKLFETSGRTEALTYLASQAIGLRYDSDDAKKILDVLDWASHWPVIDNQGCLTGDVKETDDMDEYANVDDLACIAIDDLTSEQLEKSGGRQGIRESGYACL